MSPPNVNDLLDSAEAATRNILELLDATREANETLTTERNAYKRKCKALTIAVEKLKAERQKDRKTIELWKERLNELEKLGRVCPAPSDVATYDSEACATQSSIGLHDPKIKDDLVLSESSNEVSDYGATSKISPSLNEHDASNQRVLPMSIEVSSLPLGNSDDAINAITSSPPANKPHLGHYGSQKRLMFDENPQTKRSKENICLQRREWLQSLFERDWHPADFRIAEEENDDTRPMGPRPFRCPSGNCKDCKQSTSLLNNLGSMAAERHVENGFEDQQNTPAGFWEVDFPNSSQIEMYQAENREKNSFEGRQRLAKTLWRGQFAFRDPTLNQEARILMR